MCVKLVRCVDPTRPASAPMPGGAARVKLTFCTRRPAATIRTVVSGVPAAPAAMQMSAETPTAIRKRMPLAPTAAHRENRANSWASTRSLSLEASSG